MLLAVEAFALALLSLHRFPNQRNRSEEKSEAEGKKIHTEEKSETAKEEGKNSLNRVKKTAAKKIHVKTARFAGIQFHPWQIHKIQASAVLFQGRLPKGQETSHPEGLVGKTRERKILSGRGKRQAGSGVAKGPSWLLEKHHPVAQTYLTRRVLGASPS